MNQHRINTSVYIMADILICLLTWTLFYYLRGVIYGYGFKMPQEFFLGLIIYMVGWLGLNSLAGFYHSIYQKSRIVEFFKTMLVTLIGSLLMLFFYVLKNAVVEDTDFYKEFLAIFLPIFFITAIVRISLISKARRQIKNGSVFFNTLLVGAGHKLKEFYKRLIDQQPHTGFKLSALINLDSNGKSFSANGVPVLNKQIDVPEAIHAYQINEVVIAVDKKERETIVGLLQKLSTQNVNIKITPDTLDLLSGSTNPYSALGMPLIDVHYGQLPMWQQNVKRVFDIVFSFVCLIVFAPLIVYAMIRVALASSGPLIYKQERIGYKGRPFTMYKIRSMEKDAEKEGPQLSGDFDPRVFKWGRIMRKWRLDELPQLWNILKGDMSFVGPRPERKYYIDQIVKLHPEYNYLFKVKPGLSSWGMVKYGYASSINEMIERMPYDLMYVEDASLALDIKIMWHTISIILKGKGK